MISLILGLLIMFSQSSYALSKNLPFFEQEDLTPYWQGTQSSRSFKPAKIPSFQLHDQDNQSVSEKNLLGHTSVVSFFFTRCGSICPLMIQNLKTLQSKMDKTHKIHFYSFSVTPDIDTPEQLKSYAQKLKIDETTWRLLTGKKEIIYELGRKIFKADKGQAEDIRNSNFIHSENIYLIDSNLLIRGIYQSLKRDSLNLLLKDLEKENSNN